MTAALQVKVGFDRELPTVTNDRTARIEKTIRDRLGAGWDTRVDVATSQRRGTATATIDTELQQRDLDGVVTALASLSSIPGGPSPQVVDATIRAVEGR